MSRMKKNIICCSALVVITGVSVVTMYFAGNSIEGGSVIENNVVQNIPGGAPPDINNNNNNGIGGPPDMKNNGDTSSNEKSNKSSQNGDNGNRPERPDKQNGESRGTPPEKPSGDNSNNNDTNHGTPPTMPDGDNNGMPFLNQSTNENTSSELNSLYYVAFGVEGLLISLILMYLIVSKFNKKSFKEVVKDTDKIVIIGLGATIITATITYIDGIISKNVFYKNNTVISQNNSVSASGNTTVTEKKSLTSSYQSTKSDEAVILVKDGGKATIENATINKKSGDSSNTENSDFYGVNSGVLVQSNSSATIKNSNIKTSAKGGNAVFATGENSKIVIEDTTIETTGESSSRGLDATYGGTIKANNVTIKTQGGSSATLATDRGEGKVKVSNSALETNGSGSPVIYSTGDISINNTTGVANNSQMVVVEGKNSATITNSKLSASGKGNRGDVDQAGIMIYQSMSGDAGEGTGTFTADKSELSISKDSSYYETAPMFFVTNTKANINLKDTRISYGSNCLLSIKGTDEWGNKDNNGGNVVFQADNQSLKGNIDIDSISTLSFQLTNNSSYQGIINGDNTGKEIKVTLDKTSKMKLMGDTYITSLEDEDESYSNIDFNGYTLYVNGVSVR